MLAVWGGSELDSFRAMVKPFETQIGISVTYEGTRDLNAVLVTRFKGGPCAGSRSTRSHREGEPGSSLPPFCPPSFLKQPLQQHDG